MLSSACSQETNLEGFRDDEIANMLTLNSVVTPDSAISVVATKPYFFSDVHNGYDFVDDLSIEVWINDIHKGAMSYDYQNNRYRIDETPSAGDRIMISTIYNGKKVSASDVVPHQAVIEEVRVERKGPMHIFGNRDYMMTYYVTFTDNADEENYYFFAYDQYGSSIETNMGQKDYSHEFVFQQLARTINATVPGWAPSSEMGLPFSDVGINGETHTLTVKEVIQNSGFDYVTKWKSLPRFFKLYSISKPYYSYLVSLLCNGNGKDNIQSGMIDFGLVEPLKIYGNINGGLGVLGCYSHHIQVIDVIDLLGSFPEK